METSEFLINGDPWPTNCKVLYILYIILTSEISLFFKEKYTQVIRRGPNLKTLPMLSCNISEEQQSSTSNSKVWRCLAKEGQSNSTQ